MNILCYVTVFFLFTVYLSTAEQLQCYNCNSNFQKCGVSQNFVASNFETSYCSGSCLKITVYPGDFVLRTCSTLMNSLTNPTNLSIVNPNPGECYIDVFTDQHNLTPVPAYYCYCNDKKGCNQATFASQNVVLVYLLFIFVYGADSIY